MSGAEETVSDDFASNDFCSAVCEEFADVFSDGGLEDPIPHDCLEPLLQVLGPKFDSATLATVTEQQLELLQNEFRMWFESDAITTDQIRSAIARVLWRWPPTDTG